MAPTLLPVIGPTAVLIGRDAKRHGRNGWAWGPLFLWQPVIVGITYLIFRSRRTSRARSELTVGVLGRAVRRTHMAASRQDASDAMPPR